MNADRLSPRLVSAFILILLTLSACGPTLTPTPFRPPTEPASPSPRRTDLAPGATVSSLIPTLAFTLTPAPPTPTPPCADNLTFLNDLTYPDGTVVLPGESMDKQWLVQNTGTCDWDARYTLRFIGGDPLGAEEVIPLYPARAGARVTLSILFVAAAAPGTYESVWQAARPDGTLFGDAVFLLITVASY
jgi:hypothetical protein